MKTPISHLTDYAANAANTAANAAANAAAKKDIQAKCVAIVRKHFPALPTKEKTK